METEDEAFDMLSEAVDVAAEPIPVVVSEQDLFQDLKETKQTSAAALRSGRTRSSGGSCEQYLDLLSGIYHKPPDVAPAVVVVGLATDGVKTDAATNTVDIDEERSQTDSGPAPIR